MELEVELNQLREENEKLKQIVVHNKFEYSTCFRFPTLFMFNLF